MNRAEMILAARDEAMTPKLDSIGQSIGYGNVQSILGKLWDERLLKDYGAPVGRGRMGVTANEREAYRRGWEDCMKKWADHMKRMSKAIKTTGSTR